MATKPAEEGTDAETAEGADATEEITPVERPEGGTTVPASEGTDEGAETTEGAPVEGDAEAKTDVEGDEKAKEEADKAKSAEIPEETLKAAAQKYANKTMAAARRALTKVEDAQRETASVKTELDTYKGFVQQLRDKPGEALRRLGFRTTREFLDHIVATGGGEDKTPTEAERIDAIERDRQEERAAAKTREAQERVDAFQRNVFTAVAEKKAEFPLTATKGGRALLWDSIVEYSKLHGDVTEDAVWYLARQVEKDLKGDEDEDSGRPAETKTGTSAADNAAPAARNGGKTLTNRSTSAAPSRRELSMDPDERRRQVTEDMRAAGEL